MTKKPFGSTISGLELTADKLDPAKPDAFADALRIALTKMKDDRLDWYLGQMRSRASVVNTLPAWSAGFAVVGALFSALTVVVRAFSLAKILPWDAADVVMMAVAVVAYALMTALLLYERLTEGSGGYFRAATTVVAIRDLWSEFHFADIGRALAPTLPNNEDEIARWLTPAQAFCKSLDAIVAAEMTEWKSAYQATAKLRSETADEGLKAAIAELKLSADAAAASADAAAKKAEDATKAAEAAARDAVIAAANAGAPATLNLTLGTSGNVGEAVIKIDGAAMARAANQTSFSFPRLKQGEHLIHVEFTPSEAGKPPISVEKSLELKGGLNAETIALF